MLPGTHIEVSPPGIFRRESDKGFEASKAG